MNRRISLLISIFTVAVGGLATISPTFAAESGESGGKRYWTVDNLIKINNSINAERDALCNGDKACERNFYDEKMISEDEEFMLADYFSNFRFLISAINFRGDKIRVLYHDEDSEMRRWGESIKEDVDMMYIVWLEDSVKDPRTDFSWFSQPHPQYVENLITNGESDGVHVLLHKDNSTEGKTGWLKPNVEVELPIKNYNPEDDNLKALFYHLKIGTYEPFNAFEFGSCWEATKDEPDTECRYVFYEDHTRGFLPFQIDRTVANDDSNLTMQDDQNGSTDIGANNVKNLSNIDNESVQNPDATRLSEPIESNALAPNTGKEHYKEASEFPWWIGFILVLGGTILAWLFWPKHKNHGKNNVKKGHKSL